MANKEALTAMLRAEIDAPGTAIIRVDLHAVGFLGSSGLEALLSAYRAAEAAGRSLVVVQARGGPLRALQITGLLPTLGGDRAA